MPSLRDRLAAINKEIAAADERVEDQLGVIETLAADGHDTQAAMDVLVTLEQSVRILRNQQADIEEQIRRESSC